MRMEKQQDKNLGALTFKNNVGSHFLSNKKESLKDQS